MKLAICLALFAITSFVASQSMNDANFLLKHSWTSTGTYPANLTNVECCMPEGTLTFSPGLSSFFVFLSASQWTGGLCADMEMTPSTAVIFLFNETSSYNQLVASGGQYNVDAAVNMTSTVGNYSISSTGVVSWTLNINFNTDLRINLPDGGECTVTLTYQDNSDSDSDFLTSHTWQANGTFPTDLTNADCCMPEGTITFIQDTTTGEVSLHATQWNGDLCANFDAMDMIFPFELTSSYNGLSGLANQVSSQDLIFNVGNFSNTNTGVISWTMSINFEQSLYQGGICSVTLTTGSDLSGFTIGTAFSAFFALIVAIIL